MSPRSFRRAQQRRRAGERRRELLRSRRAQLAAGAFALVSPASASADFQVTSLNDGPVASCTGTTCATLRDAVAAANSTAGADTITFDSSLTGTLRLTQGEIAVNATDGAATTISGAGTAGISISGDADDSGTANAGDSRILNLGGTGPTTISNLTLTEGFADGSSGGAILNSTTSGTGQLMVSGSTISDNTATGSGGGISEGSNAGALTVTDSTISGNTASGGGGGGGIDGAKYSGVTVSGSTISGNSAGGPGGGIIAGGKYAPLRVSGSTISGNMAAGPGGGGISFSNSTCPPPYCTPAPSTSEILNTTISENRATGAGGEGAGILVGGLIDGDRFTISRSTISANEGGAGTSGGGIGFSATLFGAFELSDSTISYNRADTGAGVNLGNTGTPLVSGAGSLALNNSTITSNIAAVNGGGLYLTSYGGGPTSATIPLDSTIVGNNIANGAPQDLDRDDNSTGGGFNLAFSLVESPGDAPVNQTSPSLLGVDPQLNVLAGNGGPTQTMLPLTTSPVVDKGRANGLLTDQRGFPRTVDGTGVPNAADGTDIGSVEIPNPPATPASVKKKKCKPRGKKKGKKSSAESAKKKKKKCKKKKRKKGKR